MSYRRFQDRTVSDNSERISRLKIRRMGPIAVLCIVLVTTMTLSLVYLRIRGLSLDSRLDSLCCELVLIDRALSDIEKTTLAVGSPSTVYGYAFNKLGMTQGAVAGIVRIRYDQGEVALVVPEGQVKDWSGALPLSGFNDIKDLTYVD